MDISKKEARVRPRHHQPVSSQYRTWWGYGPEVRGKGGMVWWWGEGKRSICGSYPSLFWEVRPTGMTNHPKKARLRGEPLGACLEGKREKAFIPWQKRSATVD